MGKKYILYNPLAGNNTCEEAIEELKDIFNEELVYVDFCKLAGQIERFFNELEMDDQVILCGGDGTINYFINAIDTDKIENEVFYFPAGSGNDFCRDIEDGVEGKVYPINAYIKNLPFVEVNGIKKKFINGIGYGIDGYCCEEGDKIRIKSPGERVNYTTIALKGLLYDFKRVNAVINIDGQEYKYSNVWMAPSMNGCFYGGGMMCAPNQDRINNGNKVSVIVVHTRSRIKLLFAFLSIFKGEHLKYKKIVTEIKGSDVKVTFDKPTALQIDGETVTNVLTYSVYRD